MYLAYAILMVFFLTVYYKTCWEAPLREKTVYPVKAKIKHVITYHFWFFLMLGTCWALAYVAYGSRA